MQLAPYIWNSEMLTLFVWEQHIDSQVFIHIMSTSNSGFPLVLDPLVRSLKAIIETKFCQGKGVNSWDFWVVGTGGGVKLKLVAGNKTITVSLFSAQSAGTNVSSHCPFWAAKLCSACLFELNVLLGFHVELLYPSFFMWSVWFKEKK